MRPATYYAAYLLKFLWTSAAIILVLVAAVLSIVRLSLPYLDDQKTLLQDYLLANYGLQLHIGYLSAEWQGTGPYLVLHNTRLSQNQRSPIALDVKKTEIKVDFWSSVIAGQIQSERFELSGLTFSLDLAQLQGTEKGFPVVDALKTLFLEQLKHFSISDSRIVLDVHNKQKQIDIEQLSWINRDQRHQGEGRLKVEQLAANSTYFVLDLYGGIDDLNGQFFAKAEELDISPWVSQQLTSNLALQQSLANMEVYAWIAKGQIEGVEVDFQPSTFHWKRADTSLELQLLGGQLIARPTGQNWHFQLDNFALLIDQQPFVSHWLGRWGSTGLTLNLQQPLQLSPLLPMLQLVADKQQWQQLSALSPSMHVHTLSLFHYSDNTQLAADINHLGWQQHQHIPGIENLNGRFFWSGDQGHIELFSQNSRLHINNVLDNDLNYQLLDVSAYLHLADSHWELSIPRLQLLSEVLSFNQQLHFSSDTQALSAIGHIEPLAMEQVKQLMPKDLLGADTRQYLLRALQAGNVERAALLWRGKASDYPFAQHQGLFQASVDVSNTRFAFDKNWPALTQMQANLLFENESLIIQSQSAKLLNVQVADAVGIIPRLQEESYVQVTATGSGNAQAVSQVMQQSSLRDSVGEILQQEVQPSGQLQAKLNLHIPLTGTDVVAKGQVDFVDNQIYVTAVDAQLSQVSGSLSFENERIRIDTMQANLLEQPITLSVKGEDQPQGYHLDIDLSGDWQIQPLLTRFHPGLESYLDGHSPWQAQVSLDLTADHYQYRATVGSQLLSLSSTLPAPFAKTVKQALPATVVLEGDPQASKVAIQLADIATFNGILPHESMQFSRAHLSVGEQELVGLGLGFSISANLEKMDYMQWHRAIEALQDAPSSDKPMLKAPQRIYANAKQVTLLGQQLDDVQLLGKQNNRDWLLSINAEQTKAELTLYDDWMAKGIQLQADYLRLQPWPETAEQDQQTNEWNYSQLPPINIQCKQCSYDNTPLGEVEISLNPAPNGMTIEHIALQNDHGTLNASGSWLIQDKQSRTHLSGNLSSSDFGDLLSDFGMQSGIKDSKANFDFDLSWQHAPHEFNFESLNGEMRWHLTDGYITDLPDKGSRIFSLLSIETLVRKLSLDFRDVFAKGFFYDKMQGSFQLDNGKAITQDTVIDGGAGEMTIAGYADLAQQTLNYQIGFTPNVTSSLPLLVYFMVNPATAIAALAVDQVLTEAKVIYHARYSVTGTFEQPQISQLSKDAKDVALPTKTPTAATDSQQGFIAPQPIDINTPRD